MKTETPWSGELGQSPDCVMDAVDALLDTLVERDIHTLDGSEAMCIIQKSCLARAADLADVPLDTDRLIRMAPLLLECAGSLAGGSGVAGGRGVAAAFLLATTLHGLLGAARRAAYHGGRVPDATD